MNADVIQVCINQSTCRAGVLIFCIAFGIIIGLMGERARVMFEFFSELNEVVMRIVGVVMWSVIQT